VQAGIITKGISSASAVGSTVGAALLERAVLGAGGVEVGTGITPVITAETT